MPAAKRWKARSLAYERRRRAIYPDIALIELFQAFRMKKGAAGVAAVAAAKKADSRSRKHRS